MYGLHGTVVSVHPVYSTDRTMVGVSLPYCLHVLLQYTPHGTVVSVHPVYSTQVLFVLPSRWCVRLQHHLHVLQYTPHGTIILVPQTSDYLYRIVCIYTLHAAATVVSVRPLYSTAPCAPCWYDNSMLTSLQTSWCHIFFANSTLITTSFSSFLSLSASLSTPVVLPLIPDDFVHRCLVVLVDCCSVVCDFTMMNLVLAFFLLSVRHYRIVCMFSTGCMVR